MYIYIQNFWAGLYTPWIKHLPHRYEDKICIPSTYQRVRHGSPLNLSSQEAETGSAGQLWPD